jgi:hypothetical protein
MPADAGEGRMLFASEVTVAHQNVATLDLVIIGIYFAIVFGIGMYFARRERTSEDYFLAGRDIGWFFIGASLFVSNISTEHFIGLSGSRASSCWFLAGCSCLSTCAPTYSPCRNSSSAGLIAIAPFI